MSAHSTTYISVRPNLHSSVPIHVGLPQQSPRFSAGDVVTKGPKNVNHLRGVDAVGVVLVVKSKRSLDGLQESRPDLEKYICLQQTITTDFWHK